MGQFLNVRVIGTGAGADARSTTGGTTTGQDYTQLNIVNLSNFWVHSLSGGGFSSSMTASSACGTISGGNASASIHSSTLAGIFGTAASAVGLTAAAFLKVVSDVGQVWMIPLLSEPKS